MGHSFFLEGTRPIKSIAQLIDVLRDDVIPLLEEYCYEDFSRLEEILGSSLVDSARQCVRTELLTLSRAPDLVQALLAPCPEIVTAATFVARDEDSGSGDADEATDAAAGDEESASPA